MKTRIHYTNYLLYLQHMTEKADHALVKIVRDREDPGLNLSEESCYMLIIKRKSATEQGIEYHTTRPDINFRTSI